MVRGFGSFLCLGLMIFGVMSCGPGKSAKDRQDEQLRENIQQKKAELDRLVGEYRGTLIFDSDGRVQPIVFELIPLKIISGNPSTGDVREVPTLGGVIYFVTMDEEGNEKRNSNFTYKVANYNSGTGEITFYGEGAVQMYFEGHVEGKQIIGRPYTSLRLNVGTIDVLKVQ